MALRPGGARGQYPCQPIDSQGLSEDQSTATATSTLLANCNRMATPPRGTPRELSPILEQKATSPRDTSWELPPLLPQTRSLSWADLTEQEYGVTRLYGEETTYLKLLAASRQRKKISSSLGPRPSSAALCSLCEYPPNNAIAECGCGNFYCHEHGGTCACGFTGCGLCLAHHPCPFDVAQKSPTLLEALDLARATSTELPEQVVVTVSQAAPVEKNTVKLTTKTEYSFQTDYSERRLAKWLESELRKLPLKVIEVSGRGRTRTGPTPQWLPKRIRHRPCASKRTDKCQASCSTDQTTAPSCPVKRKVLLREKPKTLDARTFQKLQDERHALRVAFDDFVTTLQQNVKKPRPRRQGFVVRCSTEASTSGTGDARKELTENWEQKQRATDRRFCKRMKTRGLAVGSTRPVSKDDPREQQQLERLNLGVAAASEVLAVRARRGVRHAGVAVSRAFHPLARDRDAQILERAHRLGQQGVALIQVAASDDD